MLKLYIYSLNKLRGLLVIFLMICTLLTLKAQILPVTTLSVFAGKSLKDIKLIMAKYSEWSYSSENSYIISYGNISIETEFAVWEMNGYEEGRYFTQKLKVITPKLGLKENIIAYSTNSEYIYSSYKNQCSSPCLSNTSKDVVYNYFNKSFNYYDKLFSDFKNINEGGLSGNCTYAGGNDYSYDILVFPPKLISAVFDLNVQKIYENSSSNIADLENFIASNYNKKYTILAENRLGELWFVKLSQSNSITAIDTYLKTNPDAKNKKQILELRQKITFENALVLKDVEEILDEIKINNFTPEQKSKLDIRIIELQLFLQQQQKIQESIAEGDRLYALKVYDQAKSVYNEVELLDRSGIIKSKIELCEIGICNVIISKGDSLFDAKFYREALDLYNNSKKCFKSESIFQDKIKITNKRILEEKIQKLNEQGEIYFKENKYDLAIAAYRSILSLDVINLSAQKSIQEIEKIIEMLNLRTTKVFAYKQTNYKNYIGFQNSILSDLNAHISQDKKGYINVTFHIYFDTLGKNLSSVKNILASSSIYTKYFSKISNSSYLEPYRQGEYFLASEDDLALDIKWSSTKEIYKTNSKGVFQSNNVTENKAIISNYLSKQPYKNGKCFVDIKNKELNGATFTDIEITKYKTVGPRAALYSAIMPGLGTLKVTYGNKGWGRLTSFLLLSSVAVGSKLYSDEQYAKYLTATSLVDADNYYNNANNANKLAFITGGLSATIYLYDIFWVFSKGLKNKSESRPIRKQLRKGSINIKSEPIKL